MASWKTAVDVDHQLQKDMKLTADDTWTVASCLRRSSGPLAYSNDPLTRHRNQLERFNPPSDP